MMFAVFYNASVKAKISQKTSWATPMSLAKKNIGLQTQKWGFQVKECEGPMNYSICPAGQDFFGDECNKS